MGKKYDAVAAKVDRDQLYSVDDAFKMLPDLGCAKFDETVELSGMLGVDPRKADQLVRGTVVLPNGTGKTVRVLVFAKGEKENEAKEAGADFVGAEDMIEKISKEGWLDFDSVISTPDMMGQVSKLGKVLGPRGLMPNPKIGTVTFDIAKAVAEVKAGKVEYRVDKTANIHVSIGKVSFGAEKLRENFNSLVDAIIKAKPSASKGSYLKSLNLCTTMGPGIRLDTADVRNSFK